MVVFTATDGRTFTSRSDWRKYEFESQYTFRSRRNEKLVKFPDAIQGQPFDLSDLENCEIHLLDHSDQIQCDNLKECRLFIGGCSESLFIRNCENCTIYAACKQLRTRDCSNCIISLYCKTEPIIETSHNMQFGPFRGAYLGHSGHLKSANLTLPNMWYAIFDFNDAQKTGSNWSLMEKEQVPIWRPLNDEAEVAISYTSSESNSKIQVYSNQFKEADIIYNDNVTMVSYSNDSLIHSTILPEGPEKKKSSKIGWSESRLKTNVEAISLSTKSMLYDENDTADYTAAFQKGPEIKQSSKIGLNENRSKTNNIDKNLVSSASYEFVDDVTNETQVLSPKVTDFVIPNCVNCNMQIEEVLLSEKTRKNGWTEWNLEKDSDVVITESDDTFKSNKDDKIGNEDASDCGVNSSIEAFFMKVCKTDKSKSFDDNINQESSNMFQISSTSDYKLSPILPDCLPTPEEPSHDSNSNDGIVAIQHDSTSDSERPDVTVEVCNNGNHDLSSGNDSSREIEGETILFNTLFSEHCIQSFVQDVSHNKDTACLDNEKINELLTIEFLNYKVSADSNCNCDGTSAKTGEFLIAANNVVDSKDDNNAKNDFENELKTHDIVINETNPILQNIGESDSSISMESFESDNFDHESNNLVHKYHASNTEPLAQNSNDDSSFDDSIESFEKDIYSFEDDIDENVQIEVKLGDFERQSVIITTQSSVEIDLNKVSDAELMNAKVEMDVNFLKNQILPDDPGYIHDKRLHIDEPCEENNWDDDSEIEFE